MSKNSIRELSDGYRVDLLESRDREQNPKILALQRENVTLHTDISRLQEDVATLRNILRNCLGRLQQQQDMSPDYSPNFSDLINQV